MNRKLVNGLLLLSVATVGCGTFTSCKDTDEDFKNEIILDQTQLRADLIRLIEENRCKCDPDLAEALLNFAKANGWSDSQHDFATIMASWLASQIGQDNLTYLSGSDGNLRKVANDLTKLSTSLKADSTAFKNSIDSLLIRVDSLEKKKFEVVDTMPLHNQLVKLREEVAANKKELARLDSVDSVMSADLTRVSNLAAANRVSIDSIAAITAKLEPLINANSDRLNKLITSIITQQTYNPLFGSINLPIGLQSNVVANYYGYTDRQIDFPFGGTEYNGDKSVINDPAVWDAIETLGYTAKPVSGYYMSDDNDHNLGTLYVTINPNNINFNGSKLSLVNSKDVVALDVTAEKDDDTELKFGFNTRANNGFYAAKANIAASDAPKLAIHVEDGLKGAMKDALLDHTKQDFVALGKVLFNQMQDICPAYALKAEWEAPANVKDADGNYTTETQKFAVYSNYNIAAATVHPLGYEFLYGEGTSKELPTFGRFKDALHNLFEDIKKDAKFDFEDSDIKVNPTSIVISLKGLTITIDEEKKHFDDPAEIKLGYDGNKVWNAGDNDVALNPFVDEIVGQIQDQIDNIEGQINSQIGTILDKIENQLAGKLNGVEKLVDKYNALANKINNFLKNPNNYLQVMMAYETKNDGLHQLSNSYNDPSYFNQAGGNSIELFATSYTAELVAPSYLKFVAVTRAWNVNTKAEAPEVAKDVNTASEHLNVVRPGRQQRFGLTGLKSGYKYEIVYTSLDYRGYTSTNLYYLIVK